MNEEKIYGELIWQLAKERKFNLIDKLIRKLKNAGKGYLLKSIANYLNEKYNEENGIIKGNLKLAFDDDVEKIVSFLSKKLKKRIQLEKIGIDESLILGGAFIGKNVKVDFSFKNLIKQIITMK